MTPDELAALHGVCFTAHPRPWTALEFANLLNNPLNFLLTRPQAFLLGRTVAEEAELLTLAVAPQARRQGLAFALLSEFAATAQARGATEGFLEVASDNAAAMALYSGTGWDIVGCRKGYYAPGTDAVVMRRVL